MVRDDRLEPAEQTKDANGKAVETSTAAQDKQIPSPTKSVRSSLFTGTVGRWG